MVLGFYKKCVLILLCYYFHRAITPRLTIYVSFDGSLYHAIYLHANTTVELAQKLCKLPGFTEYLGPTANGIMSEPNVFSAWSKCAK